MCNTFSAQLSLLNSAQASVNSMNISLDNSSFSPPICLSGCTAKQAFLYILWTSLCWTNWCIPHWVHLELAQMTVCKEHKSALKFRDLPSFQAKTLASSGVIVFIVSAFFISPIDLLELFPLPFPAGPKNPGPNKSSKGGDFGLSWWVDRGFWVVISHFWPHLGCFQDH